MNSDFSGSAGDGRQQDAGRHAVRYFLHHRTAYRYSAPVSISHHSACVCPINSPHQTLERFRLILDPATQDLSEYTDYFGNVRHQFSITRSHDTLTIDMLALVRKLREDPPLARVSPTCEEVRLALAEPRSREDNRASEFCYRTPLTIASEEIEDFARRIFLADRPFLEAAIAFSRAVRDAFVFDPEATDVNTPPTVFWEKKGGVCQDFAHFTLACLRALGYSAAYISGYILTHPPAGRPRLEGADATHAWVSVYVPGLGWVELDPTNGLVCNLEHVQVARGRDYQDIAPVKGAVSGGGKQEVQVSVTMQPDTESDPGENWQNKLEGIANPNSPS